MSFQSDVECYTAVDPMPTLRNLSKLTGVPVEKIVQYVLVKYAASGSDALLAMEPIVFRQMREIVARAEENDSDAARVEGYRSLKKLVDFLGLEPREIPETTGPEAGVAPESLRRGGNL